MASRCVSARRRAASFAAAGSRRSPGGLGESPRAGFELADRKLADPLAERDIAGPRSPPSAAEICTAHLSGLVEGERGTLVAKRRRRQEPAGSVCRYVHEFS